MEYYAGIDVSLEQCSVCVMDASGKIVRETKVASEPAALSRYFAEFELPIVRIGLEAGPLSQWLREGLVNAGFDVVLLETRHVKAALSAMTVKTDRKDARGIAQLLRMGWFRPVHAKSADAQAVRALLVGRKLLQAKLRDVELSIRGILRGYGLKVGEVSRGRFDARIRDLIEGHDMLTTVISAILKARAALWDEFTRLHREMLKIARADPVCHRLMNVPGVGALVALTYRSAVDDPERFSKSRTVGAYFGLTPGKYQSGETDRDGGITRVGDAMVRTALYEAAHIMLTRASRFSALKGWAMGVAKRRGMKRAKVALARKLATVLHCMWIDASAFRWGKEVVTV
ncbi:IS110 family transposase [Paracoccus saliphilus]|uniref:Transposase n=1 Tax=Paracoccus saliphilus TaxID=405559 RepID=A0AA45W8S6_9RHOB|nr:IS110 family transposase [Paracoccus saliphilus]WCR02239.1 IS110 family transposase [Paracoccus saliphilus]WCR04361.1 IS110 family transposase [Paracoccus saliphilus]SIT19025.1 Transposase [Paracoccus saliphilus]